MPPPGPALPLLMAVGATLAGAVIVELAVRRPPALLDRADEALAATRALGVDDVTALDAVRALTTAGPP